jgi:glycine cleavage system H protein
MIYFTSSHEWILVDGDKAKVGITNYAQKELGDIVYVELPQPDRVFQMGEEICVLESTKAAADVYAPVSGKVIAVNEQLKTEAALVNKDPEISGFLFEMQISNPKELEYLLSLQRYQSEVLGRESQVF